MNHNLYAQLERRFPLDRHRLVLETDAGSRYTYEDMDRIAAAYAGLFHRLGLKPGDRLAARVDKSPEALFLYLAALRFGLVYLPLNTDYRQQELAYFFQDAEPALVVGRPGDESTLGALLPPGTHLYTLGRDGTLPQAAAAADAFTDCRTVDLHDTAAIVYTSGTTGRPKGAMISHDNLANNAETLAAAWGFSDDDVLLHVLPLFHVHGLFVACHCVLWSGSGIRFLHDAGVDNMLRHLPDTTVMMGVPTHYTRLLNSRLFNRDICRRIRLFVSGSAPLLPQTFRDFEQRTGHRILERYGMTETGMNTSNPLNGRRRPGTVGPPLPGVAIRIVDRDGAPVPPGETGALQVRGPNVFKGYWGRPGKTAEEFTGDGYFITGDLASRDEDGYVRIEGRDKDLIVSGGYNVYPKEIELCIDGMPGIAESAVIGVPDADFGEAVCAVIVPGPGEPVSEKSVIAYCKDRLAGFKAPKSVRIIKQLPRNAMGKVQKNLLREQFSTVRG